MWCNFEKRDPQLKRVVAPKTNLSLHRHDLFLHKPSSLTLLFCSYSTLFFEEICGKTSMTVESCDSAGKYLLKIGKT